jgi:hypothetical protein
MKHNAHIIILGLFATSCGVQPIENNNARRGSGLKSVTINQPKLRESMDKNLSADVAKQADEMIKNLVVKISSQAKNCNDGVTAESKDFGEKKLDEASVDSTYKFKRGCDYVVTLSYTDSVSKTLMLASDGQTINLTKADLETAKPVAKVLLKVSPAGKKFWSSASTIETPNDGDVSIDPTIDQGASLAGVPACMSAPAKDMVTAASCFNEYRSFLMTVADKFSSETWHADYMNLMNDTKALPAVDATNKFLICQMAFEDLEHFDWARLSIVDFGPINEARTTLYKQLSNLGSTKGMRLFRAIEGFSGVGHEPIDEGTPMPALNLIDSVCAGHRT